MLGRLGWVKSGVARLKRVSLCRWPWSPWDPVRATEVVWSLLYPDVCQVCGVRQANRGEGYVCGACRGKAGNLRPVRAPFCDRCGLPFAGALSGPFRCSNCADRELHFDHARAAVVATPFLLEVLHRYKYGRERWFAPFLVGLLVDAAAPALTGGGWDGLVPVPLHPGRESEREFNQAFELAAALAQATGIPLCPQLVQRRGRTRTQALLTREERVKNVRGAFLLREGCRLAGQRWVVVDDVLTTGATTSEVAGALKSAGAREVCVWTLGRAV